jgi:hypothetical protein
MASKKEILVFDGNGTLVVLRSCYVSCRAQNRRILGSVEAVFFVVAYLYNIVPFILPELVVCRSLIVKARFPSACRLQCIGYI